MGHWLSGFGFGVSLCWSHWGCLPGPQYYDNTWASQWISPRLAFPPIQLHPFDYVGSWDLNSIHPSTSMPQSQPRGHSPLSTNAPFGKKRARRALGTPRVILHTLYRPSWVCPLGLMIQPSELSILYFTPDVSHSDRTSIHVPLQTLLHCRSHLFCPYFS